jgi:hypothetical protein
VTVRVVAIPYINQSCDFESLTKLVIFKISARKAEFHISAMYPQKKCPLKIADIVNISQGKHPLAIFHMSVISG